MGTIIELITKDTVAVDEDLLTVQKIIQEKQFGTFIKKHTKHTVIINRDAIALLRASVD